MDKVTAQMFERAFADAMPHFRESINKSLIEAGMMPLSIADAQASFCELWPDVESNINIAIRVLKLWKPASAAAIKGFIAAFKTTFLPLVCPIPEK